MRAFILISTAVTTFFLVGCFHSNHTDNSSDSNESILQGGHANIRLAQIHTSFHAAIEVNLEKVLKIHRKFIEDQIRFKAENTTPSPTQSEIETMTQSVIKVARPYFRKRFQETHTSMLHEYYNRQVETLDALHFENRLDPLDESEIKNIQTGIESFFSSQQGSIEEVCQKSITDALAEIFQRTYADYREAADTEPVKDTFEKNSERTSFYHKMQTLFPDFNVSRDHNDSGRYKHSPASKNIYDKIPVTNVFDGKKLTINKPVYTTDSFSIETTQCDVDFKNIENYQPVSDQTTYLSTAIDRKGDGDFALLVFKRYHQDNTYIYLPFLIENDYCRTKSLVKLRPYFTEVQDFHITDIVTANFDNDTGMEIAIAIAGNDKNTGNRFFIYDDFYNNFRLITDFKFSSLALEHAIVRLASGDSDGNGFDEIAAVSYNARAKSWNAQLFAWEPNDINYSFSPDNTIVKYTFDHKTPVDLVYADLNKVDHIELFAVQVDPKRELINHAGDSYQPQQKDKRDDYCRFFATSTNYLDVIRFGYDFDSKQYGNEKKQLKIINRTFDKQYNRGLDDDGVKCLALGCWCDDDFRAKAYHLYAPYTIKDTDITQWKPIYITPVHLSEDSVSLLDIDGFSYNYSTATSTKVYTPANHYNSAKKHGSYHYVPVRSNCRDHDCSATRQYVEHMLEGSRLYSRSRYTRSMPSAENEETNKTEKITRKYDDNLKVIRRLSTFPYITRVLSFQFHDILYSKEPTIDYIIAPPPDIAGGTSFELEFEKCQEHERLTKKWHGGYFGISLMAGWKEDGAGQETEILGGLAFKTTQSSGKIFGHKAEKCLSRTMKITNDSSDAIIHFRTNLIDVYAYKIVKDLDEEKNDVGKMIYITVARNPNDPEFKEYEQTWDLEKFEKTAKEYNISLGFDANLSKLLNHNLNGSINQENFYSILRDPKAVLSNAFDYLFFWYPDENIQIPESEVEASLKFSTGYSKINGYHDEDEYELGVKFKSAFSWGAAIEIDAEAGWTWGAKHEDIYSTTNTTSYGLSVEGDGTSSDQSIGVFSYHVLPEKMSDECTIKKEIPIERSQGYDPNRKIDCKEAIMVIDFFTAKDPHNKSPGEIQ